MDFSLVAKSQSSERLFWLNFASILDGSRDVPGEKE
jgi:hypothetical protein